PDGARTTASVLSAPRRTETLLFVTSSGPSATTARPAELKSIGAVVTTARVAVAPRHDGITPSTDLRRMSSASLAVSLPSPCGEGHTSPRRSYFEATA